MEIKLNHAHCFRCNHEWVPRKPKIHVCPNCHSFLWYEEKGVRSDKWKDKKVNNE